MIPRAAIALRHGNRCAGLLERDARARHERHWTCIASTLPFVPLSRSRKATFGGRSMARTANWDT